MENNRGTLFVVLALICSVFVKNGAAISCYVCQNDASGKDTNGCGANSASNPINTTSVVAGTMIPCASCSMQVYSVNSFSRGCVSTTQPTRCSGVLCTCNTDNCNDKPIVYGRGSLQCYSCSSTDYLDNGCGAKIDPSSVYVNVSSGCTACTKSVNQSPGGGSYTRGCSYSAISSDSCASAYSYSCLSTCQSNLCNTATTTTTTTTRYPIILALGMAIYGIAWL